MCKPLPWKDRPFSPAPSRAQPIPILRKSGQVPRDITFDVYPVGGVVPLMEAYRYSDLVDVVTAAKKGLGSGQPVHLFGAGHPMIFALAAAMGCDLFDSAAYALYARQDRYLTVHGTGKLAEMSYLPCSCPVCQEHTLKELMESPKKTKLLARHNLYVSLQEMKQVKESIREGSLWDLLDALSLAPPNAGRLKEARRPAPVARETRHSQQVHILLHKPRVR